MRMVAFNSLHWAYFSLTPSSFATAEIQGALGAAGFQLSVPTVKTLMWTYDKVR